MYLCQALGAGSSDREQVCKTLDTELSDIKVDGDEATATLHYTYEENGKRYGADADVTFERIDGQWYISKLQGKLKDQFTMTSIALFNVRSMPSGPTART